MATYLGSIRKPVKHTEDVFSAEVVLFPVIFFKILDNIVTLVHRYIPLRINEVRDLILATRN